MAAPVLKSGMPTGNSTSLGFDRVWYAEQGLTWLVRAAEVGVLAPIRYGDHFDGGDGSRRCPGVNGLTLDALIAAPHGIDLGPLEPRLPDGLRTPTGMIDVAPQAILDDLPRMEAALQRSDDGMLLIGRRDLRSNNSWMHNVEVLVKGKPRCVLHVHPDDAASKGLVDGGQAKVTSRVGTVGVPVEVTDAIRPGVVSLPHGWGHDLPGSRLDA